jgi:hypothetical protein
MPRKRRNDKRRLDWRAEMEAWENMFCHGHFLFDDEPLTLGLPEKPDPAVIAEAWHRLGASFIATHGRENDSGTALWALAQFGEPAHAD